jgi:peptidoglycan/LPS O-acetylase OafA/YrhL
MSAKSSSPYLTTLTPLRGIAALLVTVFHCNKFYQVFIPPGKTQFIELSWLWVDFFFILSGFILCYAYGKYFNNGVRKAPYKKYFAARFARVYPLHFVTTFWAFACALLIVPQAVSLDPVFATLFDRKALLNCLLLIQSMHLGYVTAPLNNPSWSLSTEWWVYMIFPFFVPYFISLKTRGKLLTTLLIVACYVGLKYLEHRPVGAQGNFPNMMTDFGFLRCLAGFFTGMLLFTFYEHRAAYNLMRQDWFFAICFGAALLCLHLGITHIVIIAFFPFILISAAYNQTRVKRILDTRVLQRLGDWSFSLYLVHIPVIYTFYIFDIRRDPSLFADLNKFFNRPPDYSTGALMCLVIVAISIFISAFTYRLVEVPARNYFNKIFKTNQPRIKTEGVKV